MTKVVTQVKTGERNNNMFVVVLGNSPASKGDNVELFYKNKRLGDFHVTVTYSKELGSVSKADLNKFPVSYRELPLFWAKLESGYGLGMASNSIVTFIELSEVVSDKDSL